MTDNPWIQQGVNDAMAKFLADHEAARRVPAPTAEQQLAQRLNEARFREQVTEQALLHGVKPHAIRHIVRDAEQMFELKDDALVARHNATDPNDPLSPLTAARWLLDLAKTEGYLFAPPTRAH